MTELERLLEWARHYEMSPEEQFEQKVSFAYGQMMDCAPHVTKNQVREAARNSVTSSDLSYPLKTALVA